jgi:organic radical activating enzyme
MFNLKLKEIKDVPSETWCTLPWQGAVVQPWGEIQPCVYIDSIRADSFAKLRDLPQLRELKQQLLQGEKPKVCQACWKSEGAKNTSWRQMRYDQLSDRTTIEQKSNPEYWIPDYFELYLDNICNCKCRMCKPKWSSAWMADYKDPEVKEIFNYSPALEQQVVRRNVVSKALLDEMITIIDKKDTETTVSLRGGEPFYSDQSYYIMEELIRKDCAHRVSINLSTNGTIYDPVFMDLMSRFKKIKLGVSLDGSGKLNNYIRGTDVPSYKIYEHTRQFLKLENLYSFYISNTIQIYNAFDNAKLKAEVYQELGFNPDVDDKCLYNPVHLKIHILPDQLKQMIDCESAKTSALLEHEDEVLLKKWADWTLALDRVRHEKLEDVCPELAPLLETSSKLPVLWKTNVKYDR